MPLRRPLAAALFALGLALPARRWAAAQGQEPAKPPVSAPVPVVPPRPLTPLHADYPEGAHGDADVVLVLVINADGSIRKARAEIGDEPFITAAVAASSGWRFEPATRDGKPIASTIKAQIRFTAPPPPEPAPPPEAASATKAPAAPPPPPKVKALEVTVKGEQPAPGVQSFTRAEVRLLPGAFGDPFRAIDALPGVTPLVSGLPFFYVRGAPPGDVGYFLDGIRVPLLYHVGLGPSVVNPAIMDRVDLYSGGYPASYGRYAGGIVAGETREPDPAWHAEGNVRLIDAGAMVQGPLPNDLGSFILAGRYSYTAALLTLISSNINLAYWDYQARLNFKVTPRDSLTVFAFGAHDFLGTKSQEVTDRKTGAMSLMAAATLFDTTFHRVDLRYDHRFGGPEDRIREAVTLGYDQTSFAQGAFVNDYLISARSEITKRASESVLVRAGLDAQLDDYQADLGPAFSNNPGFTSLFPNHTEVTIGVRADAVLEITRRFEVTPGVRLDFFGSHVRGLGSAAYSAVAVDPRLAARLEVTRDVRLVTAHGFASQQPSFILPGPGFARPLAGGLQRSFQSSLGVEADLPWDVSATVTAFRDAFFNLTDALGSTSLDTRNFGGDLASRVNGSSIGLEVMLRRRLTRRLGGLVSYTLSRSERIISFPVVVRQQGVQRVLAGGIDAPSSFDRTHVLNVAGSYDFGRGVRGGTRMLFYTGFPVDNLDPSMGTVPPFLRLDARLEKRWSIVHGRGWVSLVLEGQNVFGAKETVQETPVMKCLVPNPPKGNCPPGLLVPTGQYAATQIGPVSIPSIGLEGGF
jgi:hypothetical protein